MTSNGPDSYQRHRAPDARSPVFEKWGGVAIGRTCWLGVNGRSRLGGRDDYRVLEDLRFTKSVRINP